MRIITKEELKQVFMGGVPVVALVLYVVGMLLFLGFAIAMFNVHKGLLIMWIMFAVLSAIILWPPLKAWRAILEREARIKKDKTNNRP
jgi:uncharacterized membrane protein